MNFLLNLEDFRWIFSRIQRILNRFSPKFEEFQMDFLLIQKFLGEFFPEFGGF